MPDNPLTFAERRDPGQELPQTRRRMRQLSRMVLDVYGANYRCAFAFEKLNLAVNRLVDELAWQALADCPART